MKTAEVLHHIRTAARQRTTLRMRYVDAKGAVTDREVEPYSFRGHLFYGFDVKKKAIRSFRIAQIVAAVETRRKFKPQWPIEIAQKKTS